MIVGGADLVIALAAFGHSEHAYLDRLPPRLRAGWERWAAPFWQRLRGRVGCTPATLRHLWHGPMENRRYTRRLEILRDHDFDPDVDVASEPHGLLRWATPKSTMHEAVQAYFSERGEDA